MFAVIHGNPDGIHRVTLWSKREYADEHVKKEAARRPPGLKGIDYVKVVPASVDDGQDFTMNEELD